MKTTGLFCCVFGLFYCCIRSLLTDVIVGVPGTSLHPGDSLPPPVGVSFLINSRELFLSHFLSQPVSIPASKCLEKRTVEPSTKLEDQEQQWTAQAPGLRIPLAKILKSQSPYTFTIQIQSRCEADFLEFSRRDESFPQRGAGAKDNASPRPVSNQVSKETYYSVKRDLL
jgi:hypothetical protein